MGMLQDQSRLGQPPQNRSPATDRRLTNLCEPAERPKGDITLFERGQGADIRQYVRTPKAGEIRQIDHTFGKEPAIGFGNKYGTPQQVVDRLEAGSGDLAPGRNLDRRRLTRQDKEPVARHMPKAVDKNIDPIT